MTRRFVGTLRCRSLTLIKAMQPVMSFLPMVRQGAIARLFCGRRWLFAASIALTVLIGRVARADTTGTWYDGDNPIPPPNVTLNYYPTSSSYSWAGLGDHVTFDATPLLSQAPAGSTFNWADTRNWDDFLAPYTYGAYTFNYEDPEDGDYRLIETGFSSGTAVFTVTATPNEALLPIYPAAPISIATRYDVTIDNSRTALLDQTVTLDSLSVESGSTVAFQPGYSLTLPRGSSLNAGTVTQANIFLLGGTTLRTRAASNGSMAISPAYSTTRGRSTGTAAVI